DIRSSAPCQHFLSQVDCQSGPQGQLRGILHAWALHVYELSRPLAERSYCTHDSVDPTIVYEDKKCTYRLREHRRTSPELLLCYRLMVCEKRFFSDSRRRTPCIQS